MNIDSGKFATDQYVILGDNISADEILHARYAMLPDKTEMAQHIFEDLGSEINNKVKASTVIVAGKNFGCGSSRESSAVAIKYSNVKAVIAESFARIFYRNAINQGLLVVECPGVNFLIAGKSTITIDTVKGVVSGDNEELPFNSLPQIIQDILISGSLVEYGRKIIGEKRGKG